MNIIRSLFFIFLVIGAFALVGIFLLFTPTGQTWVIQSRLDHPNGIHGNVGSFWAFFGSLQIDDLRLERDGYVLTAPHVEAKLPVSRALVWRTLAVKTLTAKGWTLDLTRIPDPTAANAVTTSTTPTANETANSDAQTDSDAANSGDKAVAQKTAEYVFRGVLDAWRLPMETSLEQADLDGDVLLPAAVGEKPIKVHVTLTGGGLRSGVEGKFKIVAGTSILTLQHDPVFVDVNAELTVRPSDAGRSWEKLSLSGNVDLKGGSFPEELQLTASATATRRKDSESYDFALAKNQRAVLSASLNYPTGARQISGEWKLNWQHEDSALLWADRAWPSFAATGGGRIDVADTLQSEHVVGGLQTDTEDLGKWAPSLKRLKNVPLVLTFDATAQGSIIHAEQLKVALPGLDPALSAQLVGPIEIDWTAGTWTPTNAGQVDLAHLAVNRLPLVSLTGLFDRWQFTSGEASGEFLVQASKDHLSARPKMPLTASHVTFSNGEKAIAENVDVSASIAADYAADAWKIQYSPVIFTQAGKTLLTLALTQEKAAEKPLKLKLNFKGDMSAGGETTSPTGDVIAFRTVDGDFSGSIDPSLKGEGEVNFVGASSDDALRVQFGMSLGQSDTVSFRAPLSLTWGKRKSDVVVEGTYAHTHEGHGLDATISGSLVHLDQLEWLTAHVAQLDALDETPTLPPPTKQPFWRDWFGDFTLNFTEVEAGGSLFKEVGGTASLTRDGLKLSYGHYVGADLLNIPVTANLTFHPAEPETYQATGTIGARKIDAKDFFPAPKRDDDPVFEGKFSLETAFTAKGKDWADLLAHAEKQYHLASTTGIVRLLKVDVADAIPQPTSVVSDSASTVGNAFGKVLGRHGFGSGTIQLPKHTQAVIDFTLGTSEILYKEIQITATQGVDGNIRVDHIEMQAEEEHLVGAGELTFVAGQPLTKWPLHFDFKFGARGKLIEPLRTAHLLSGEKDSAGYELLNGDARFEGSFQNFDPKPWHDFLAAAATAKIPDEKNTAPKSTLPAKK